ncbi:membrane biogenesis protein [Collinsella sp. zg1085]|uniref:BtpA/SgcQ family protein n=1 Tax=Collinsella sp. zg1085 TaxID=2844380 RepID=UPI001C0E8EC8|nr:BtpA/SgcQ family protein [Collinsella sp. zg1085]QWT17559.1 membrane biogenesis protein [Collinsella sp. zg1085]
MEVDYKYQGVGSAYLNLSSFAEKHRVSGRQRGQTTQEETRWSRIFTVAKPIIGMLHLKGENHTGVLERAKRELELYVQGGVDAVIVESYFGSYNNMVDVLEYLEQQQYPLSYGVNCLNVDVMGFELALAYAAKFVQLDSVVGHIQPRDEPALAAFLHLYRARYSGAVLGGVRFKYQPLLSNHTVEEDLATAQMRCDAVCVTGNATGQETSQEKISHFRVALGAFPLIVGAGVTAENVAANLRMADGAIVGSFFKDTYQDDGELSLEHIRQFMAAVYHIREKEEAT